jgi:hypothetical protein
VDPPKISPKRGLGRKRFSSDIVVEGLALMCRRREIDGMQMMTRMKSDIQGKGHIVPLDDLTISL